MCDDGAEIYNLNGRNGFLSCSDVNNSFTVSMNFVEKSALFNGVLDLVQYYGSMALAALFSFGFSISLGPVVSWYFRRQCEVF